jgi:hypothetical protein
MTANQLTHSIPATSGDFSAFKSFSAEVAAFFDAVLNPSKIIDEVKLAHALRRQADGLDATDPAQATLLRQRASRVGLR